MTEEQKRVLRKVLDSNTFQNLIGAESWNLTEEEEWILWNIIKTGEPK